MANFDTRIRRQSKVTLANISIGTTSDGIYETGTDATVDASTATTLWTWTIAADSYDAIDRISCSGDYPAKFELSVDGTVIETRRTTAENLNTDFGFNIPFIFSPEEVVTLDVTHTDTGNTHSYESTMFGHLASTVADAPYLLQETLSGILIDE